MECIVHRLRARTVCAPRELVRFVNAHSPYDADVIRERGISLETCMPHDFLHERR